MGKIQLGPQNGVCYIEVSAVTCPLYRAFVMRVWPGFHPFPRKVSAVERYPLWRMSTIRRFQCNLKLNRIPWKINKKEIIINNNASVQSKTLLKMNSLMNLFWWFQYFSSISLTNFDTIQIQLLKCYF